MMNQQFWITQVRDTIYFTKDKPETGTTSVPPGIVAVIQSFTDVAELKQLFGLEIGAPKYIAMSEVQEQEPVEEVVNG